MKSTKKILLAALVILIVATIGVTLVACNSSLEEQLRDLQNRVNGFEQDFAEKSITVYVGEKEFSVKTRKSFLHDVLRDLKNEGKISQYTYTGGDLSPFVTQIDDLQQDFDNFKYYSVWHSLDIFSLKQVYSGFMPGRGVQKTEGEGEYATTFVATQYRGKLLYYSNVGVGPLPIADGAAYAILID